MVTTFVALIIAGRRTIKDVPAKLHDAVVADLIALELEELTIAE